MPDAQAVATGIADEPTHILMKVETHNHPTAISPFPGAATGSGGEIRDEGATGRGAKPKAGLTGFTVSHLRIPGFAQDWEPDFRQPGRMATPLQIMIDGPHRRRCVQQRIRTAESRRLFPDLRRPRPGRPRSVRGYHKPIMIAGGVGNIAPTHARKSRFAAGSLIVQLGGPAMLIGLGGGAASSMGTGTNEEGLDFDSVQRGNAEIERRAQEVIDRCCAWGGQPDPFDPRRRRGRTLERGAGARAFGGARRLARPAQSAQRRARHVADADLVQRGAGALCARDCARSASAVFEPSVRARALSVRGHGHATDDGRLTVAIRCSTTSRSTWTSRCFSASRRRCGATCNASAARAAALRCAGIDLHEAALRVLRLPAVADKTFLILDRRPHRRWSVCARSDGRPVAGAGRRCRRDARWVPDVPRRSVRDGRAHAACGDRSRRRRDGWRWAKRSPISPRRRSRLRRREAFRQLDGRSRSSRRGRAPVRHGARRWRSICVQPSASAFPSARIRCR